MRNNELWLLTTKLDQFPKHNVEGKKSGTKEYMWYDPLH
jgi:hypothetical protein